MKKISICIMMILLVGCQQSTASLQTEQTKRQTFHTYQEFSNIYEAAEVKCGNDENYYFENVEVDYIDKEQNKLLVILRNSENKRYSAWVQFEELPTYIPKNINIKVGPFIKESLPPILDGIEIYEKSNNHQYTYYHEYDNLFEGAIVECGKQEKYYFQKVEVIDFDRENNKALVTLRNSQDKKYSAYIQFDELPWNVPRYANITVGSSVLETFPPILEGMKIEPYTEK